MKLGKREKAPAAAPQPFHNPFGGLPERLGMAPAPSEPSPSPGQLSPAGAAPRGPARAVVRLERKGRGGKEATVIDKLDLAPGELAGWLSALKASLGCGGGLEGDLLVLQGDQRQRLRALLEGRGVRKVIMG